MGKKIDYAALLSKRGPLADLIENYRVREPQQQMAQVVGETLEARSIAIIEAGTGIGKTFAYLVPALVSGGQTVISTGTRTLQDQLFQKDLPLVKKALHSSSKLALLKGRSNYLCLHRMKRADNVQFNELSSVTQLKRIVDWSIITASGDIAELSAIPKESEVWPQITSTIDNCLGKECSDYQGCFVVKARQEAQDADIVVVNHHLFFADLKLKEEGFGELLPRADAIILDEAHQLAEIASAFFSQSFSSRKARLLAKEIIAETELSGDMNTLKEAAKVMDKAILDLRLAMDKPGQRQAWHKIKDQVGIKKAFTKLEESITTVVELLTLVATRSNVLDSFCEQSEMMKQQLNIMYSSESHSVQWYEVFTRSFSLVSTPLNVANTFSHYIEDYQCAWVFTSATLAINGSFDHFSKRLGIHGATTLYLDSPFDYWNHSLLYVPNAMPEPYQSDFGEKMMNAALPVIKASTGGVFVLFTSYRAMHEAHRQIVETLSDRLILMQGEQSQNDMIEAFRHDGNAILLGTNSFWEGVDVRGSALSCVIIDKLPFASPGDPVIEAQIQTLKEQGGNAFFDFQVPQAVIALKQGVGRLIRDTSDRGVLMICDPRIKTKNYGGIFLESLPRMPRTQKQEVVERFFTISVPVE